MGAATYFPTSSQGKNALLSACFNSVRWRAAPGDDENYVYAIALL